MSTGVCVRVCACVYMCTSLPVLGLVPTTFMRQKEKNSVAPKLSRSEWHEHPLPPSHSLFTFKSLPPFFLFHSSLSLSSSFFIHFLQKILLLVTLCHLQSCHCPIHIHACFHFNLHNSHFDTLSLTRDSGLQAYTHT